jgi:hypothetical protein
MGYLTPSWLDADLHSQNMGAEEMMHMRLAGVAANRAAQMQAHVAQQAAVMQWLQMNQMSDDGQFPTMPDALSQQPQSVHILDTPLPSRGLLGASAGEQQPILPTGMTLRLAAAGVGLPQDEQPVKVKTGKMSQSAAKSANQRGTQPPAPAKADKSRESLRSVLSELRNEDPKRVFITRRIKDLGFRSKDLLKQHFSQYGEVAQVLIPHTKVKPGRDSIGRSRPGNFGLVVMGSPAVVQRIFAEGSEHTINGVQIEVQVFELPSRPDDREPDEAEEKAEEQAEATPDDEEASPSPPGEPISPHELQSTDDHEVGESRSGGCSDERPGSSNGGERQGSSNGAAHADSVNGADARPMSVGDWRQSRLETGAENKQSSRTEQPTEDASAALPLDVVLGAIGRLSRLPGNGDLAGEMTQVVAEMLKEPEKTAKIEGCKGKLTQCLVTAAGRLLADAHTLQASASAVDAPGLPAPDCTSLARAVAAEVAARSAKNPSDLSTTDSIGDNATITDTSSQPALLPMPWPAPQQQPQSLPWLAGVAASLPVPSLPPGLPSPDAFAAPASGQPVRISIMPQPNPEVANADDDHDSRPPLLTLRSHLKEVSNLDPACIFVARKIHTLGFHSHKRLREHYSQFGLVVKVLVAHRKLKAIPDANGVLGLPRKRPGSLGLIVMKHASSVQAIMALGEDQVIAGHAIRVELFSPSKTDDLTTDEASTTAESSGFERSHHNSPDGYWRGAHRMNPHGGRITFPSAAQIAIPESEQFIDRLSF